MVRSGRFILGPNVEAFEDEVAEYLGVKHAVGVNSGTDALVIGLRALGIEPGDEVITTPFTFFATPESISIVGATPVFVDIDPVTFNIDPQLIEAAITPRTKAILPVHLFGQPCDMERIREIAEHHDLKVLEDVAQAMGAAYKGKRVGGFGDAAALSFFPSKNLGGFGDGGMIVTDDDGVAAFSRMLRQHGSQTKYANEILGYNSRLDELQAAILRVRLRDLDVMNDHRRRVAALYTESLSNVRGVQLPAEAPETFHVFHQYTIRTDADTRDVLRERLTQAGVETMIYYPKPCHLLPVYESSDLRLIAAEHAANAVLSLPIGPSLPPEAIKRVASAMR